jgi:hypothetical protein
MLLEITVDPSFDPDYYREVEIHSPHKIYAKVLSFRRSALSDEIYLDRCPLGIDLYDGLPVKVILTMTSGKSDLYCEWELPNDDLNYIVIPVQVKECDRFPSIRFGQASGNLHKT